RPPPGLREIHGLDAARIDLACDDRLDLEARVRLERDLEGHAARVERRGRRAPGEARAPRDAIQAAVAEHHLLGAHSRGEVLAAALALVAANLEDVGVVGG